MSVSQTRLPFIFTQKPWDTSQTAPPQTSHFSVSRIHDVEAKYYADGEDAYDMRRDFKKTPVS